MPTPAQVTEHLRSGHFPVQTGWQVYIGLTQVEAILRAECNIKTNQCLNSGLSTVELQGCKNNTQRTKSFSGSVLTVSPLCHWS